MIHGVTFGAFDLLHAGHLLFLNEARMKCDHLTVGLHIDPSSERKYKNKPIESVWTRFEKLRALTCVSDVIPYESDNDIVLISKLRAYDLRFLGSEYMIDKNFIKFKDLIPLSYIDRFHEYSSSNMRKAIIEQEKRELI